MTDILGLIFVLVGLVTYRFGPSISPIFERIGAGGERAAKAAASIRSRASGGPSINESSSYALGEHRKPLLDLEEEGEEYEGSAGYGGRRMEGGGGGKRGKEKPVKVVETEWEM